MSLGFDTAEQAVTAHLPQQETPVSGSSGWGNADDFDDSDYIPLSPWGPISALTGVCSLIAFISTFGIIVAGIGFILGVGAVVRIREARGTVKGFSSAVVGLVLSTTCLVLGSANMAWAYSTECPEGFRRVSFPEEISAKQFVHIGGFRRLHPDVVPLIDQKVFLKGFMWQTKKSSGLTEFLLLKDNGECCFGGKAQPYDMIAVYLRDGETTDAYQGMVSVAGVLTADVNAGEDAPVYRIDDAIVEESRTIF